MNKEIVFFVVSALFTMAYIGLNALVLVYLERKISADIQLRLGPMEVGPHGILQTLADALKLIGKELLSPRGVDSFLYTIGPYLVFIPCFLVFMVIPFSYKAVIANLNLGLVYILAATSIVPLGIMLSGWASRNKYSLFGAMRSIAQLLSYEIPIVVVLFTVVLFSGSMRFVDVVTSQAGLWNVVKQPVAFLIFLTATVAELNRTPFDLPEAESELVAGYHTEYSGMRFALFFLAEYTNLFLSAAICTVLFLGGWLGPFLPGPVWFLIKTYAIVFVIIWMRWAYPRVRPDQLMWFSWAVLIPLSLLNLIVTSFFVGLVR